MLYDVYEIVGVKNSLPPARADVKRYDYLLFEAYNFLMNQNAKPALAEDGRHRKKTIEFTLRIVEVIAIIIGVVFAAVQIKDVRDMQSADLMLRFNDALSTEKNSKISYTIEENKPLFTENGGEFSTIDIDNYLGMFELISTVYQARLITNDMLYDAFSSFTTRAYDNPEIKSYLAKIRRENNTYFLGFEELAKAIKVADQK